MTQKTRKKTNQRRGKPSEKILNKLNEAQNRFIKEYKLPSLTDNKGIRTFAVEFVNKFGRVEFGSLFGGKDRGLYNFACKLQAAVKKSVGQKPLPYTIDEKKWFRNYTVLKGFGKKDREKLARDYKNAFPDKPKRSEEALAWQVMHLKGKWNPEREGKTRSSKKKTETTKTKQRGFLNILKGHAWTPKEEHFLIAGMPSKGKKFKFGELRILTDQINEIFGLNLTTNAVTLKMSSLRKKREKMKKIAAKGQALVHSQVQAHKPGKKAFVPSSFGVIVEGKVVWTGDHEPQREDICVCSGVLKGFAVSVLVIEGEVLDKTFRTKPEPIICSFKTRR